MSTILPLHQSLSEYRITPDNLWAVFYRRRQRLVELEGGGPVGCKFSIASPGIEGATQIQSIESQSQHFLGCFSFLTLEHILSFLNKIPQIETKKNNYFLNFSHQDFLIFTEETNQEPKAHRVKSKTLDDAIGRVKEKHPEAIISFGGNEQDLKIMVNDMKRILSSQDFSKIEFDRRGYIEQYEANDLLLAKKTNLAVNPLSVIYS